MPTVVAATIDVAVSIGVNVVALSLGRLRTVAVAAADVGVARGVLRAIVDVVSAPVADVDVTRVDIDVAIGGQKSAVA